MPRHKSIKDLAEQYDRLAPKAKRSRFRKRYVPMVENAYRAAATQAFNRLGAEGNKYLRENGEDGKKPIEAVGNLQIDDIVNKEYGNKASDKTKQGAEMYNRKTVMNPNQRQLSNASIVNQSPTSATLTTKSKANNGG